MHAVWSPETSPTTLSVDVRRPIAALAGRHGHSIARERRVAESVGQQPAWAVPESQLHPVEGGSVNAYDYVNGDPTNNFDLDGTRCWTGVAWKEKIQYQDKDGNWNTKTKEHCRSIAKGIKRNVEGAIRGATCVAGQLAPWNYGESSLVEAGGVIGSAGVAAITYTGGGAFAAGSAGALATGVPLIVVGGALVAYGAYAVYQECHH